MAEVERISLRSRSDATLSLYELAWRTYCEWMIREGYAMREPPNGSHEDLILLFCRYLGMEKDFKVSSIEAYVAGVKYGYAQNGITVKGTAGGTSDFLAAMKRIKGSARAQKSPLRWEHLQEIIDKIEDSMMGCRDKLILLMGFCGAFRAAEMANLNIEDVQHEDEGMRVYVRKSKTDQEGKGRFVDIPANTDTAYCPVKALKNWTERAGITEGAIFRGFDFNTKELLGRIHKRTLSRIIEKRAKSLGLTNISGHSLRAGFVTCAVDCGVPDGIIMRQTGHSNQSTLRIYDRFLKSFRNNAAQSIYRRLRRI